MIPSTYSESLQNLRYGCLSNPMSTKTHKIGVVITQKPYDMTLKFDVGCFLHIPKLSKYCQNVKSGDFILR